MRSPLYVLAFMSALVTDIAHRDEREERGAAVTEYVVLIGFIVLAAAALTTAGIWNTVGSKLSGLINSI